MGLFGTGSRGQTALAVTLLRVALGIVFMAHGGQKVFTMGIAGITAGFTQMHVPVPAVTGPMISWLELGGGALLVLGLLTRVVALLLACDMAGAFLLVHRKAGFFLPMGYEFVVLLMVIAIALLLFGGGPYSVDALIASRDTESASRAGA